MSHKTLLLWSQIKPTPHEFSDLQITGEFDNYPGTGRYACSHIVRAPAGVSILVTSADVLFPHFNNVLVFLKDAMAVSFRSELFTSYIVTIFKQRNII